MNKRFDGRVAIITGGADGIGKAAALRLAREGAQVVIVDADVDRAEQTRQAFAGENLRVDTSYIDVADEATVRQTIEAVAQKHGRLDIAINCAGIVGPNAVKITEINLEDFDKVCQVNLRGSFLIVKHTVPYMLTHNYGRVLLVASIAGKEGNAGMAAYSTSKAGVIGLAKAAGKEFAETGVTINAIAPAVIRTAMVEAMAPSQVRYMTEKIPMKRCGTLNEITSMICWIVSEEASFTTGHTFDLSGGRATY